MSAPEPSTRERLLDAARALTTEGGYAAASVAAVAERAGVAPGTLYRHFASKEELFVELFRAVGARELTAMDEAAATAEDAVTRVVAAVECFARRALRRPRLAWALMAEPVDALVEAERLSHRRRYRAELAALLAAAVDAGALPAQDPDLTAAALVGGVGEVVAGPASPLPEEDRDAEAVVGMVLALTRRAVGANRDEEEEVTDQPPPREPTGPAVEPVRYERVGAAAVITIDRPERRNAVDGPTADALESAYRRFVADDQARVLIVTGSGGSFCAGADLKAIDSLTPRVTLPGGPLGFTRLTPPKPTIAAIEGYAVAGGLELALWCDLRVVGAGAQLGFTERRWGVPLIDGGTQRLPRIVGLGRALDLILSGRLVASAEAQAIGLVTEVVDDGTARARALEMAQGLAAFPQETMLADRLGAIEGTGMPLEAGLAREWLHGSGTLLVGQRGARRFAGGEGRHGAGTGV